MRDRVYQVNSKKGKEERDTSAYLSLRIKVRRCVISPFISMTNQTIALVPLLPSPSSSSFSFSSSSSFSFFVCMLSAGTKIPNCPPFPRFPWLLFVSYDFRLGHCIYPACLRLLPLFFHNLFNDLIQGSAFERSCLVGDEVDLRVHHVVWQRMRKSGVSRDHKES